MRYQLRVNILPTPIAKAGLTPQKTKTRSLTITVVTEVKFCLSENIPLTSFPHLMVKFCEKPGKGFFAEG